MTPDTGKETVLIPISVLHGIIISDISMCNQGSLYLPGA